MKRTIQLAVAAFVAVLTVGQVQAGSITFGNTSASNSNKFEDFERPGMLLDGELLTNQFAANGLTFVDNFGQAPVLFNNNSCQPAPHNLSGMSYAGFGLTTNCSIANNTSGSILFDADVSELSFDYTSNNNSNYTFEALLNGLVVSTLAISSNTVPATTTFLYTGSVFDELRFVQGDPIGTDWFWMDDLAWETASTTMEPTPEPTSLAIFGIGALCMGAGAARRRRKEKLAAA